MKFIKYAVLTVIFLLNACLCFSQPIDYTRLTENYVQALKDRDHKAIMVHWKIINANPDAQEFLEENYPWAFEAYRLISMSIKLSKDLAEYKKNYGELTTPETEVFDLDRILQEILSEEEPIPATNATQALTNPNQNQPTNQETTKRDLNAPLIDNRHQALNYLNQDQPLNKDQKSNQEIMKNQIRAMIPNPQQP
ncbi:MAG: hypothetical protein HQL16_01290 [Candidatus Omnitrophica bacterium]|nr:hypothetical protein [Candidatus Omnitrophota bacterium]